MAPDDFKPQGAHLVGSVPLGSAEEVFRTASSTLGRHLRRIPDGETGERSNWIGWQYGVLSRHPLLEAVPPETDAYAPLPRVRLKAGVRGGAAGGSGIAFGPLGYADAAKSSYAVFSRLKKERAIPPHARFQVSLPTPLAPVSTFVAPESQAALEGPYETRLLDELDEIAGSIPRDELSVQWDVAVEVAHWEGVWPAHFGNLKQGIIDRLVRAGNRVDPRVELGFHLCYGDYEHRHFKQPADLSALVEIANLVLGGLKRRLNWLHVPVPRDRVDDAYFSPLRGLNLPAESELYLGLVHFSDGAAGAGKRIAVAKRFARAFGVATECGMGRRPPETIPDLLGLHARLSRPIE
jgi:hypothetical protein